MWWSADVRLGPALPPSCHVVVARCLITAALSLTSWIRTSTAVDTYALLLEAATRVHAGDLARHLDLGLTGPFTREAGNETRLLAPSPPHPRPAAGIGPGRRRSKPAPTPRPRNPLY